MGELHLTNENFKGNHPSQELPPTPAPTLPPPNLFEQYTWAFICGAIFIVLVLLCIVKKVCCSFREEKQREKDKMELHMMQQNQMNSLMQREQYLGTPHITHQPYNNESMRSTHRSSNYVNRGLSLTTNAYRQPTNKLVYNPNYGEVQIPLNEPLIVSNRSDYD